DANFVSAYRVMSDQGEPRWFEARGDVQRDAGGNPRRTLGTAVDVTGRKRAELALRESGARMHTLAAAAFVGIAITENSTMVDVNGRLLTILGLTRDQVLGRDVTQWIASESLPLVERRLRESDTGLYEAVLVRPDGTRIHVEIQARYFQTIRGRALRVA